jgi:TIR domain
MATIYLSYRRKDSDPVAGRIFDHLSARYGEDSVQMDIGGMVAGADIYDRIHAAVARSDVVLAIIGPNWVAQEKIFDRADPVQLEIDAALHSHIPLLPVLVLGAAMPSESDLPPNLRQLTYLNTLSVDSGLNFHRDIQRLTDLIDRWLQPPAAIEARSRAPGNPPRSKMARRAPSAQTVGKALGVVAIGAAGAALVAAAPAAAAAVAIGTVGVAGGAALVAGSVAAAKRIARIARRRRVENARRASAASSAGGAATHEPAPAAARPAGAATSTAAATDAQLLEPEFVRDGEDHVSCSVFATARPQRGRAIVVQALLHRAEQLAAAAKLAIAVDPAANRKGSTKLTKKIRRGTPVQFMLEIPALAIEESLKETIWSGDAVGVTFAVQVPAKTKLGPCGGTLHVMLNGVSVGEVALELNIEEQTTSRAAADDQKLDPADTAAVIFTKAFVSYSRKDARDVLLYAEALDDCGIKVLFDLTEIEPGDEWEPKLFELINDAEVFYLMWSKNATQSKWVDIESRAAVERYDSDHMPRIRAVVIEDRAPDPPDHLARFQFNSKWLSLRQAQAHTRMSQPVARPR